MLWPICSAVLVAEHIWHGLPCTVWNGRSCPAWECSSCSVGRKSSITVLCDAERICHVGQRQQEGKWVRPLPSQKICHGPNTGISFCLLLSPLAGTWVLLADGQGLEFSRGARQLLCMVGLCHFLSCSICKRIDWRKAGLSWLNACLHTFWGVIVGKQFWQHVLIYSILIYNIIESNFLLLKFLFKLRERLHHWFQWDILQQRHVVSVVSCLVGASVWEQFGHQFQLLSFFYYIFLFLNETILHKNECISCFQ